MRYRNLKFNFVRSFQTMSANDKKSWDDYAKQGPHCKKNKVTEKYTSQGVPISQIDREQSRVLSAEKSMKQAIRDIVTNSHINGKYFGFLDFFSSILLLGLCLWWHLSAFCTSSILERSLIGGIVAFWSTLETQLHWNSNASGFLSTGRRITYRGDRECRFLMPTPSRVLVMD